MKTTNQKPASQAASVAIPALFRLALLVGPETFVVKTLSYSPVFCVLAFVVVLGVWLTIDVGPFRAAGAPKPAVAKVAQKTAPAYSQMAKAQWWSSVFCRVALAAVVLHSKFTI